MRQESSIRTAEKSKLLICNAMMELLKTTDYDGLTVSQICKTAGVSRPTFYKNFQSMDAIVYYKLHEAEKKYHTQYPAERDFHSYFECFFSFVKSNKEFDLLLVRNKLFHIYEDLIRDDFSAYVTVQREWIIDGFLRKYLPVYLSSTLVSLLKKWMESGYIESPKQMADITANLTEGYLSIYPGSDGKLRGQSANPIASIDRKSMKTQELTDILDNLPVGVCVLFMPDESHQELRLANKEQMRLINPKMTAPDKESPQLNEVRMNYYKNAFSGVHPDDLAMAYAIFRRGFHQKRFRVPQIRLRTSSGEYFWAAMDVTLRETLPDGRLFYAV